VTRLRRFAAFVVFTLGSARIAQAASASDVIQALATQTERGSLWNVSFTWIGIHSDGVAAYAQGVLVPVKGDPRVMVKGSHLPSLRSETKAPDPKAAIYFEAGGPSGATGFSFSQAHSFELDLYTKPQAGSGDMGFFVLDGREVPIHALEVTGVANTPIEGPWVLYGTDGNGAAIAIRLNPARPPK